MTAERTENAEAGESTSPAPPSEGSAMAQSVAPEQAPVNLDVGEELLAAGRRALLARQRIFPCHANRASELGHPCLRYLAYCRTHWATRELPDAALAAIFEEGHLHETAVLDYFRRATGLRIIEEQVAVSYPEHNITGHIDAVVWFPDGRACPLEVKSMAPHIWERINSMEDLAGARQFWLRKYPAQMQLYLLLRNMERGILVLKNKSSGALKAITVDWDAEYCEALLQKADAVNAHVAAGTLPDRIAYDSEVCGRYCDFRTPCSPPLPGGSLQVNLDPDLEALLDRRGAVLAPHLEFERLDKEVKAMLQGVAEAVCGNWLILGKEQVRAMKAQPAREVRFWTLNISPVQPGGTEETSDSES